MDKAITVTIDGPAGSGKSTVAGKLARKLGFIHLDSGALYRALGLQVLERGLSLEDESAVLALAREIDFTFELLPDGKTVLLVGGENLGTRLRTQAVSDAASRVALLQPVRDLLTEVQRRAGDSRSVVLEGRDAGTVVFPKASFKFYLDACTDVRAKRRFHELQASDAAEDDELFERCKRDVIERDKRDTTREAVPLRAAEDAIIIDTSELTVEEVVDEVVESIKRVEG